MTSTDIAGPTFWNDWWAKTDLTYKEDYNPPAFDLWGPYLPHGRDKSCMEIGCFPGRNLVFMHKKFGYRPIGIDYSVHLDKTHALFRQQGISDYELHRGDFLEMPTTIQADVVFSMGFVEHFVNFREVLRRHVAHVKEGGWIVVTVPNLRYGQYLLHNIFDREVVQKHVLAAMDPEALAEPLAEAGATIVAKTYWETFDWWCDNNASSRPGAFVRERLIHLSSWTKSFLLRHGWHRIGNRCFSPWVVCVARK